MNHFRISNHAARLAIAPLSIAALALFVGCQTEAIGVGGAKENRAARLVGEWISPSNPNDYLVFKPDPMETKMGRVLGLENYDNYRITGLSAVSPNLTLELSSRDEAWEERKANCTIAFLKDGVGINVTLPPAMEGARPITRYYKRSSSF